MVPISAKTLFKGIWNSAPAGVNISSVVTDSRAVTPGCVFVAIKGERVDGHDFAAGAYQAGAAVVVSQHGIEGVPADRTVIVPDILDAMIALGANYRNGFQPLLLGVTGSVGKTTTKEFCGAIFSTFGETLKTEGNQNNEIGMPNTLFRLNENTRYAVIEMGMQGLGEIAKLTKAAKPSGALITKIAPSHIETLGSLENILRAKMEICEGLPYGAPLVLNGDDELLAKATVPEGIRAVYAGLANENNEVLARDISRFDKGQKFTIQDRQFGNFEAYIPALGAHHVTDAILAYTAATRLGLNAGHCALALAGYVPTGMRQRMTQRNGVSFIEDCYNANPDSMQAALAIVSELEPAGKRIAVLGDMLELGAVSESAHRDVGRQCAQAGVGLLLTVGDQAALAAAEAGKLGVESYALHSNGEAIERLQEAAKQEDVVLVKASRGMHFEEILDGFAPVDS